MAIIVIEICIIIFLKFTWHFNTTIFTVIRTTVLLAQIFIVIRLLGSIIVLLSAYYIDFSDNRVKYYNKICVSKWRKDLLDLGFTEILGEYSKLQEHGDYMLQHFALKGIYEKLPLQINSNQYYKVIEIHIPLNLAIDESFTPYQEGFNKQYSSQNIQISQDKIVKTIKITDAVEDKIIWAAIHELQNIVNEDEYKEQKLLNYLRFDEM